MLKENSEKFIFLPSRLFLCNHIWWRVKWFSEAFLFLLISWVRKGKTFLGKARYFDFTTNLVNLRKNQTSLVNVCKNGQQDKHCLQRNDKTHGLPRLSGQSLDCTDSFKIIHTVSFVRRIAEANENLHFYRTQVSLGSDLWVRFSLTNSLRNLVADLTYLMKILTQY